MNLSRKGQIAIEYIIFIAIFLLFFQAVIKPSIDFAENIMSDVQSIAITQENVSRLADGVSSFASSMGTGKVTMNLYLPKNATITDCSSSAITYTITISNVNPKPAACNNTNFCEFTKAIFIGSHDITCDLIGPGFTGDVLIEKQATGDFDVSIK